MQFQMGVIGGGGPDRTSTHLNLLRYLLEDVLIPVAFGHDLQTISVIVHIDGTLLRSPKHGVFGLRFDKRRRAVAGNIGLPTEHDPGRLRQLIAEAFADFFQAVDAKVSKLWPSAGSASPRARAALAIYMSLDLRAFEKTGADEVEAALRKFLDSQRIARALGSDFPGPLNVGSGVVLEPDPERENGVRWVAKDNS